MMMNGRQTQEKLESRRVLRDYRLSMDGVAVIGSRRMRIDETGGEMHFWIMSLFVRPSASVVYPCAHIKQCTTCKIDALIWLQGGTERSWRCCLSIDCIWSCISYLAASVATSSDEWPWTFASAMNLKDSKGYSKELESLFFDISGLLYRRTNG